MIATCDVVSAFGGQQADDELPRQSREIQGREVRGNQDRRLRQLAQIDAATAEQEVGDLPGDAEHVVRTGAEIGVVDSREPAGQFGADLDRCRRGILPACYPLLDRAQQFDVLREFLDCGEHLRFGGLASVGSPGSRLRGVQRRADTQHRGPEALCLGADLMRRKLPFLRQLVIGQVDESRADDNALIARQADDPPRL